jgi:chromosome segregation ATPase
MKKTFNIILIIIVVPFFIPCISHSQTKKSAIEALKAENARLQKELDACRENSKSTANLNNVYKEQYTKNINEINKLQDKINGLDSILKKDDEIQHELGDLYKQQVNMTKSRGQIAQERLNLTKEKLYNLQNGLKIYNEIKGSSRTDLDPGDMSQEIQFMRKRIDELKDKNDNLKIRVLEKNGSLPSWWMD